MSENPYQKFDEEKDKKDERDIRDRIESISELLKQTKDKDDRLKCLNVLYDLYETIKIEYGGNTPEEKNIKSKLLYEIGQILDEKYSKLVEKRKYEEKQKIDKTNTDTSISKERKDLEKQLKEFNQKIRGKIKEDNERE